jgi:hypothetical protein
MKDFGATIFVDAQLSRTLQGSSLFFFAAAMQSANPMSQALV